MRGFIYFVQQRCGVKNEFTHRPHALKQRIDSFHRTMMVSMNPPIGIAKHAVVLMTGNPRVEEARKNLPRRFLSLLHSRLEAAIRAARGIDLIVASDTGGEFRLEAPVGTRSRRCRDLGERLGAAQAAAAEWGYESLLIVAGDVAGLDSRSFERAFAELSRVDCVFAPSRDGGFSLIGLRVGTRIGWQRIPWFTECAADGLRHELKAAGLSRVELPAVDDVDDPEAALRLARAIRFTSRLGALLLGLLRFGFPAGSVRATPGQFAPANAIRLRAPPAR